MRRLLRDWSADVTREYPMITLDPYGAVCDQLGVESMDPLVAPRIGDFRRDALLRTREGLGLTEHLDPQDR